MKSYIVLLLSSSLYGAIIDGNATITTLKGSGSVETNPASVGSQAKGGQTIKVEKDSSAILWLSNGSRLVLNQNSVVLFKTLKQEEGSFQTPNPEDKSQKETGASITEIEVVAGKVIGDVKKLANYSVYTLRTPVGVVTIKGTVFSVEYKKNDDGTVAFNIGCLVGRVTVQMADPNVAPISVPAGKQLSVSAPPPSPTGSGNAGGSPENKGGNKSAPMNIQLEAIPPKDMAAINIANVPPPPPAAESAPPPRSPAGMDALIRNLETTELQRTLDPSPTGG